MVIVCNRSLFNKYGWMAFVCYFENSKGTSMNITIYTKSGCPNCVTAKNLLQSLNLEYKEIDIEIEGRFANFVAHYPDAKQMPQIFIGDQRVGGLAGLKEALRLMKKTCPPCNNHCNQGRDCPARLP